MEDFDFLDTVKINIDNATIGDYQQLRDIDISSAEGKASFLEFCDKIVEGGVTQYIDQSPVIFSGIMEKVGHELEEHSQFISEAIWLAERQNNEKKSYSYPCQLPIDMAERLVERLNKNLCWIQAQDKPCPLCDEIGGSKELRWR